MNQIPRCPDCLEMMGYIGRHKGATAAETGTDYRCILCARTWRRLFGKPAIARYELEDVALGTAQRGV